MADVRADGVAPVTAVHGSAWSISSVAEDAVWVRVEADSAIGGVRRRVTAMAERLGFPADRIAMIAVAATEAASNLHKHASEGVVVVRTVRDGGEASIELICMDSGPGITDVRVSMRDGHSTNGTLGIGLGAILRTADESDLHSVPGRGTVLTTRFRSTPTPTPTPTSPLESTSGPGAGERRSAGAYGAPRPPYAGLTRPISGESSCGDAFAAWSDGDVSFGMLCDGLGHGPLAEVAALEAVRAVQEIARPAGPAEILETVHRRIGHTRGGAVAVCAVSGGRVRFAGLGNVAGWIVDLDRRQGMISTPGIAGHQRRSLREYTYDLPPGAAVILHSDGLTSRWDPRGYPGLFARGPLVIAATLLRDAGVRRDDSGILVLKPPR